MNNPFASILLATLLLSTLACPAIDAAEGAASAPAAVVVAAGGEGGTPEAPKPEKMNLFREMFTIQMSPLWLGSLLLLALIFERAKALRTRGVIDPEMIAEVIGRMAEQDVDGAQRAAAASGTVIGKAWAEALKEFALGSVNLAEVLNETTLLAIKPLKRNIMAITTLGVVSPLFGLFATVLGIIMSFSQMGAEGGADKAKLAAAIGVALFGTAGGIIVAIPAIITGRYFTAKIIGFAEQAEAAIYRINSRYTRALAETEVPEEAEAVS